jgi:hypothetical protein
MTNLLFATPWYIWLTLALVGGVVAWSGNQRQQARTRNVGLALIGASALLLVLSYFVETDLEKVKRLNAELVQAVPNHNWTTMTDLLDPGATLGTVDATLFANRAALVKGAQAAADRWGLKSVAITGTEERQDPSSAITVDINVLSKQDATDSFIPGTTSTWEMLWERDDHGEWHCNQITALKIGGEDSSHVAKYIK